MTAALLNAIALAAPSGKPRFSVQRQVNNWFELCAPTDLTRLRVSHYDYYEVLLCRSAAERLLEVMTNG